jgi:hypothetical protein
MFLYERQRELDQRYFQAVAADGKISTLDGLARPKIIDLTTR